MRPASTVHAFFSRAGSIGATTILNPAPAIDFDRSLLHLVDILVLNESELGLMTRQDLHESDPDSFLSKLLAPFKYWPAKLFVSRLESEAR
jgi:sugar/nucleoside kinase (ribokinase family)